MSADPFNIPTQPRETDATLSGRAHGIVSASPPTIQRDGCVKHIDQETAA